MWYILYYICLCFVLIYMIHSIYIHFKTQFVQKKANIIKPVQLSVEEKQSVIDDVNEKNKMKEYFKSLQ